MSQLNKPARTPRPLTHEGGPADRLRPDQTLRRIVMASLLWEDQFYVDGASHADLIRAVVPNVRPETVAALAIEARTRGNIRHTPLLLMRELARIGKLKADDLAAVIQRADELAEFLALYWAEGRQPLAASVKKGLALAFRKFDAYQLAKYNRTDRPVKLRDVLFLTHPKPAHAEQQEWWDQLAAGTLPTPDTWEVALSSGGDPLLHWTRLINENKLGGLATLRNLRNMIEACVPSPLIVQAIGQANYGRVLPFRFIAAARYAPAFEDQLEAAFFRRTTELPRLAGRTLILVDGSGSMKSPLSGKSDMTRFDAACGVAMIARELAQGASVYVFSNDAEIVPPRRGFALRDALYRTASWGGTNVWASVRTAFRAEQPNGVDRVIIVSDEQTTALDRAFGRRTPFEEARAPVPRSYMINVAAYQNGIGYNNGWTHVDGFSESIFDFLAEAESPNLTAALD